MSKQVTLDKSIEVNRTVGDVFAYITEFDNIREWDPAVRDAAKLTPGPVRAGSEFRVDMKAGFSLLYTVVEIEEDSRILMHVDSKVFTAEEEILFSAQAGSASGAARSGGKNAAQAGDTTVRYIARFNFAAPMRLATQAYPPMMERVGNSAMAGMKAALEDNFAPPEASSGTALADKLVLPGLWKFTRLGYRSSRRKWKPLSASMRGKHVVITGATSGIGLAAAQDIAARGAQLTLVARSEERARKTAAIIEAQTACPPINIELCDMASLADVHALADRLLGAGTPVDVLVNNAGALFNPRQETDEGFEKSFALLLLAPYVLTEKLHPLLSAAAGARVVNVLSGGMYSQKIDVDDLQSEQGSYSGAVAYARAKRGLMIMTEKWAARWQADGIVVNAMHPGWADTPGVEESLPEFYAMTRKLLRTPQEGADTIVWLACATEAGKVSGQFWLDREQHPSHIFRRTRETDEDRARLVEALQAFAAKTTPKKRKARRAPVKNTAARKRTRKVA
ncbi:MAG: SDR family NAD(P)-dependent oxidoreductase [Gammaproteobacteria bacterium]|nr:SDR family NAD(P)-dependent oxidoreductase [Gammaproteobacteria bacterium]